MIKCPRCGKEIEDDMDFCYHCGEVIGGSSDYSEEVVPTVKVEKKTIVSDNSVLSDEYVENGGHYIDDGSSTIGKMIKTLSIIVLILSVIGSFVIMAQLGVSIGIASLLFSVLTSLLAYGIGEIVCVLREINAKIK